MAFSLIADTEYLQKLPAYTPILKAVLKSQIQILMNQLSEQGSEECVFLTASMTDGTISHVGSKFGKLFLETHEEFKSKFLHFCLEDAHKQAAKKMTKRQPKKTKRQLSNSMFTCTSKKPRTSVAAGVGMGPKKVSVESSDITSNLHSWTKENECLSSARNGSQSSESNSTTDHLVKGESCRASAANFSDTEVDNYSSKGPSHLDDIVDETNKDGETDVDINEDDIIIKIEPGWDSESENNTFEDTKNMEYTTKADTYADACSADEPISGIEKCSPGQSSSTENCAEGTTSYMYLTSEETNSQDYSNSSVLEDTAGAVIRGIRKEYLNITNNVNIIANSTQEGKVAGAEGRSELAKPANDTSLAKYLNAGNFAPSTKQLTDRTDSRDVHNTTHVSRKVSSDSTITTLERSTPLGIGAWSKTATGKKDFVTKEELDTVVDDLRSLRRRVNRLEAAAAKTTKEEKIETEMDLKRLIENVDNVFNAVEILLLHFFDKETILQSSVTGKRANTKVNPESVKKALDFTKISKIKSVLISKFPAIQQKDITQKIHCVRKKLQRKSLKK